MSTPDTNGPDGSGSAEPAFEDVYRAAAAGGEGIPWDREHVRPELIAWLDRSRPMSGRALVVACGFGNEAEELARRGFTVDAFDVAPTAVEQCRTRHPGSAVRYRVADLLTLPSEWTHAFDLVVEIHTLQSLPATERPAAVRAVAGTVASGGVLFVRCLGRDGDEPTTGRPWPLTRTELAAVCDAGLTELEFTDEPATDNRPRFFEFVARRQIDARYEPTREQEDNR